MNVEEIKVQAQLQVGTPIQLQYVIRFINEGLNELAINYTTACKRDNITLNMEKDTWVELPNNFIEEKEIKMNGSKYENYEIENNEIRCSNKGELEISFLRIPDKVTAITDIPGIHVAYHYALALFVATREKTRLFGEEDGESSRIMNEFLIKSNITHNRIKKKRGRIKI